MSKIWAAGHPGKMGDALYCLSLLRYLHSKEDVIFDFYTSQYCAPLKELFEYQSYINSFHICEDYRVENFGCGAQPWQLPIPNEYEKIYQLGFQRTPDQMLHQFIAAEQGVHESLAIQYDFPRLGRPCGRPYVVVAPRGHTSFSQTFRDFAERVLEKEYGVAVIGGPGDNIMQNLSVMDFTGRSFLETLSYLFYADAFVGLQSSQLVLANGIDIPRIAMNDGKSWDMRHVVEYHRNFYPINPTADQILKIIQDNHANNTLYSYYP